MPAVVLHDISKTYDKGRIKAVNNISFSVEKGELFGLIGPDGAGKTSMLRILATLLLADAGQASVEGYDVVRNHRAIRGCIGYMPGKFSLYPDLTVAENLRFFATLFKTSLEANYDVIRDIYEQIKPFSSRPAGKLSGGMKQKLALCCALVHKPRVLLLDEPTTGVDTVSRKEFWEMLKQLQQQQITILVSTPYMDEAALCGRIALMQNGNMLTLDTPQAVINNFPAPLFAVRSEQFYELLQRFRSMPAVENCYAFGDSLHITLRNRQGNEEAIRQLAQSAGIFNVQVARITPTIEDSFIWLTRESAGHPVQNRQYER